ncbi:MAG: peptidase C69 [Lentisphaerae bacterium]|nr:peptidase C69 [Lentisphaerota bacterium]
MKSFRNIICLLLIATVMFSSSLLAEACTTIAAGKDATVDGSTLIAHSVDGWYDERIEIVPGGEHEDGAMVEIYRDPCQDGYRPVELVGEIPQVSETYTYFDTGYPFMNEKGITIGEHTWSGDYAAFYNGEKALFVIANLQALGLQRASTAKECVQIMGELAEQYGYADGGETLLVGDADEVWIFEIAGPGPLWTPDSGKPGAHWAARRVPDDEIHSGANRSRLGEIDFDDTENFMWSTDITEYPKELGYWEEGEPFNYSIVFDTAEDSVTYTCSGRVWRVYDLLANSQNLPLVNEEQALTDLPFSVKPDEKVSIQDFMAVYYDHYEGSVFDMTTGLAAGPWGNPIRYRASRDNKPEEVARFDWERSIAIYRCSYAFVSQMRPDLPAEIGTVLWYGCDSPDTTVHVPIYAGTTSVPEEWSNSNRWEFDQDCAWWAFNFVNNWADKGWNIVYPEIAEKRDAIEAKFFAEQPDIDAAALELYEAGDVDGAKAYLTEYVSNSMDQVYEEWWAFAWELVGKYNDGMIYNAEERSTSGFPYSLEYLEAVGYGQNMLEQHQAIPVEPVDEEIPEG